MSFSKFSMGLCALAFAALLTPLAHSRTSMPDLPIQPELTAAPATDGGGDQVNTSQDGDLSLVNGSGQTTAMTNISKDANGNITGFSAGLSSYKWNASEGRYNPTVIEFNYYVFEKLSPNRYKWSKINAWTGGVMDSGSLDT
jgi:hypothetical protein